MNTRGISYHTTKTIHLSLEPYHNAGITPEESKAVIEGIHHNYRTLWADAQGINHNWNVRGLFASDEEVREIVEEIRRRLEILLEEKGVAKLHPCGKCGHPNCGYCA